MKKLVVFFPGAGYGMDCPLLYYTDFLYETQGFERLKLDYQTILLNKNIPLEERLQELRSYIDNAFETVDINAYEEIVFVAKSIGCIEAGRLKGKYFSLVSDKHNKNSNTLKLVQIFLTPVADALLYCDKNCKVIIGTRDNAYPLFQEHCTLHQIPALYVEGGDHSLEIDQNPFESIEALKEVLEFIQK